MDKELNRNNDNGEEEERDDPRENATIEERTINEQASTYQPEVNHPNLSNENQSSESEERNEQSEDSKDKKINFDFEKSMNETKGILKDAVLRPHSLINSSRSISIETSTIILILLSLIVGVFAYFAFRGFLDNMFGGFGSLMGGSIGIDFLFKTMLSWVITFAVGYFSLYLMLRYFGNKKMEHKALLTKYVVVNIPFVLVFSVVLVFFGLVMTDLFMVMYLFSLMLFGMIHVYVFLVNVEKPKFDLFWLISAYLLVLIVMTYYLAGIDIFGF